MKPRISSGFTLLEVLVVVMIVAVLTGTVIVGFGSQDKNFYHDSHTTHLAGLIRLAQNESLQRNREWGIHFEENSYRFTEYDPLVGQWSTVETRPFQSESLDAGLFYRVTTESYTLTPAGEDEEVDLPEIILYSSGDHTPFTIDLASNDEVLGWQVSSNGLSVSHGQVEL